MEPFVLEKADNGCELLALAPFTRAYPQLSAGFTTRLGGVSRGDFSSLNCGLHVADEPGDVVRNRRLLAEALEFPFDACTYAEQVHGNEIQVVTKAWRGAGNDSREKALQAKDGFVTNERGVYLHALFADCVPLYFYDPIRQAVGLAHAGWKGTALQIAKALLETMSAAYGTKPRDVRAAIGPSIGACCYEVDDTVIGRIDRALREADEEATVQPADVLCYEQQPNGKYKLNLQQVNRQIMIKAGILPSHIEITGLCTSCHTDLFFSHRKEGGRTGRMAAWIGLREA
ncbi:peptidoglycan editing factor PgeF [Paenibacillus validus]|uniref:Purine nucleoside phosphorylase n=1 Tax=Paenibacillus validus TaxID=44253 RepID=A0A7X3CTA4_9BACL|nr:peptidoglycan editing factor PgeF [Paenibacillus validus]MED4603632.1 peptidoglycan editing factor PgeF [Paenibacillus validus]MED4605805.1 peptidoglycan editing factor PgeF [Paenibacillus validus]MUG72610.1 peptidoglycan editing factor PgeF [Paenibacillus validus]